MIAQQIENQLRDDGQNNQADGESFTVKKPHDLNTLMKTLRETLVNSASQQASTEETKLNQTSDDQETSQP